MAHKLSVFSKPNHFKDVGCTAHLCTSDSHLSVARQRSPEARHALDTHSSAMASKMVLKRALLSLRAVCATGGGSHSSHEGLSSSSDMPAISSDAVQQSRLVRQL